MQAKKTKFLSLIMVISSMIFFTCIPYAVATPIDLTQFVTRVPSDVTFGPNINDATLYEDVGYSSTYLSNDPFLGDPGIFVPANMSTLTFDLDFFTTSNDSFSFGLLDPSGGALFFDFFHDGTAMGPGSYQYSDVTIDLIGLNLLGVTIGLEFYLQSN
ncbi:MAG: hypothetical protein GY699_06535, partial [Desulfobacteraceae bacterium]|nr:hypothetical protein [Desulfobacteraceae bacterium]